MARASAWRTRSTGTVTRSDLDAASSAVFSTTMSVMRENLALYPADGQMGKAPFSGGGGQGRAQCRAASREPRVRGGGGASRLGGRYRGRKARQSPVPYPVVGVGSGATLIGAPAPL